MEVGGRWSLETVEFVRLLAASKARSAPLLLRKATEQSWYNRWADMLSVAAQLALATSLLELPLGGAACQNGDTPLLSEVPAEDRLLAPAAFSRLAPR